MEMTRPHTVTLTLPDGQKSTGIYDYSTAEYIKRNFKMLVRFVGRVGDTETVIDAAEVTWH